MKNPFNPFNAQSILFGLGLTLVTSLVLPVIEELITSNRRQKKDIFKLHTNNNKEILLKKNHQ